MANVRFVLDIAKVVDEDKEVTTGLVIEEEVERVATLVSQGEMSNSLRSKIVELKQMACVLCILQHSFGTYPG